MQLMALPGMPPCRAKNGGVPVREVNGAVPEWTLSRQSRTLLAASME